MPATIAGYKVHPYAKLFPLLGSDDLAALVADIRAKGLREPVTMYEGKILDGRNRARACQAAKVKIRTRAYKGKDPQGYVVSMNLQRRHLDESQRAMVAARLAQLERGRPKKNAPSGAVSQQGAAQALNVSRREVQRARQVLEHADPELVRAVEAGHVSVAAAEKAASRSKRDQRKLAGAAARGETPAQVLRELHRKDREKKMAGIRKGNRALKGQQQYGVILADPSWMYRDGTVPPSRRIDNHYPPMPLPEICALPVRKLALPDAVLFLWITSPLLFECGPSVLEAWGFTYKAQWIWRKKGRRRKDGTVGKKPRGTGHWSEVEHELVLIATRGKPPLPPVKARFPSTFEAPLGGHSEKPPEVHRRIEAMYPKAAKIELFARKAPKGWSVWGNQV